MKTNRLMMESVPYKGECRIDFSFDLPPRTDRPLQNECNIWHGFLNRPITPADHTSSRRGGAGKPAVLTTRNYDRNCNRSIDRSTTFSTITIASSIAITQLF